MAANNNPQGVAVGNPQLLTPARRTSAHIPKKPTKEKASDLEEFELVGKVWYNPDQKSLNMDNYPVPEFPNTKRRLFEDDN